MKRKTENVTKEGKGGEIKEELGHSKYSVNFSEEFLCNWYEEGIIKNPLMKENVCYWGMQDQDKACTTERDFMNHFYK